MILDHLLARAAARLAAAGSPSPRFDAEVLLCHALGVDRTWLYTWGTARRRASQGRASRRWWRPASRASRSPT